MGCAMKTEATGSMKAAAGTEAAALKAGRRRNAGRMKKEGNAYDQF